MGNVEGSVERGRWKLNDNGNRLDFAWGCKETRGTTGSITFNPTRVMFDNTYIKRTSTDYKYFVGSMWGLKQYQERRISQDQVIADFHSSSMTQPQSDYMADAGYYCLHGQYH